MTMYTKCAGCKSAISFEPPANLLPEGYKHRIKCPVCGVTLAVKLNGDGANEMQFQTAENNLVNEQLSFEPVDNSYDSLLHNAVDNQVADGAVDIVDEADIAAVPVKRKKKAAIIRNLFMIVFSLAFIILSLVCYLVIKGVFATGFDFTSYYNGIYLWELVFTLPEYFAESFATSVPWAMLELIPLVLVTFACINLIVSIVSAIGKKYSRVFNLIWAILMFALSVTIIFVPYLYTLLAQAQLDIPTDMNFVGYIKSILSYQYATIYIGAIIGFVQLICTLVFLIPLNKKTK